MHRASINYRYVWDVSAHPLEESLSIGGRHKIETSFMEDPYRLQAIGLNLGDYTQWVRLHAPTGRKVSRSEDGMRKKKE